MNSTLGYIDGTTALKNEEYEALNAEIAFSGNPPRIKAVTKAKQRRLHTYLFFKRGFDIFASFFGLVFLLPLFLIVATIIRIDSKGKAIYAHNRIGRNGKPFKMYKFRSMVHNADEVLSRFTPEQKAKFEVNFKLEDDPRITKIGVVLRKTSLDELPQLINILRGELSIVGPRPIVKSEMYKYGENMNKLTCVKPGLTGYWQVRGRSTTTYEERVAMDMFYIDNLSLLLDVKIFFATFAAVLRKQGAH
ncbi:MAG: sugar transferase [Oscillospiraceae bacterium]|jgi:lipopolysaccharide/colanic/teichoic acid biosynthesis glycosyltransferase|nr:sugar transferase [Oscillospiraceae bacterium]